jgi:tetratricopeptide (TPR) repeat protein
MVSRVMVRAMLVIGLTAIVPAALAGPVTIDGAMWSGPTQATELDGASRSITDVEQAVKSFEKRDFDLCIQQLTKARKAHPELPPPHALLAKLAFMSNQGALIRPALERAVMEDTEHPEVFILFANLALAENRTTDAAVHFDRAMSLAAAKRWTAEQRTRFERLCDQGYAILAENRGDWKAARAALDRWVKQQPGNAKARQRLGKALFGVGEYEPAYAELQRAAKEDPTLEPAAITMGWLFTRAGNLKKAEEWMDYGAKAAPDSLAVQTGVTAWLIEQGRPEEAGSHAESASKLDPKSSAIKRLLGLAARLRKDLGQAEQIFDALSTESPADAWIRNQLALVLAEQTNASKRKRALELAELSVRQNPKGADSLATLGTVYYRLGRLEEAEKVLQAVVAIGQANSDTALILAHVRADRGQTDTTAPLLKMALNASGLFIDRKDAQQWLDRLTSTSK